MRHTRATREVVVALIRANTRPLLELAREFEVSTNTLRAWLRESNLRQRSQTEARRIATTLNTPQTETLASGQALAQRSRLLMHALEHSPATIIITELMEAELASRRNVSMFRSMFAALPFPVMLVDSGGFLQYANQAAEFLCGIALTAGNHFAQLNLRWVDAEGHALGSNHPLVRLLSGDEPTEDTWTRLGIVSPTGGTRWVESFLQRLFVPETRDHAALLIITPTETT